MKNFKTQLWEKDFPLVELASNFLLDVDYDHLAIAHIDFSHHKIYGKNLVKINDKIFFPEELIFDLASITKPLTMGLTLLKCEKEKIKLDEKFLLLAEHRSSIPAWAILSKIDYQQVINSFPIKSAQDLYSDLGAIRFQLEFEKMINTPAENFISPSYAPGVFHWLSEKNIHGQPVHDPNAFNIKKFLFHAGMFANFQGLALTLLNWQDKFDFIGKIKHQILIDRKKENKRFCQSFDTKQSEQSLSSTLASTTTFGHLGFTGTSFWIDPEKMQGQIIFSNATKNYWYNKQKLNQFRISYAEQCFQLHHI